MTIDIVLKIKLNPSGHDNDRLSHKEHEYPLQQGHGENNHAIVQNAAGEDLVSLILKSETIKNFVYTNILLNKVKGMTDDQGRDNPKEVGNDDEYGTQYKVVFVFQQILIEVS